MEQEQNSPILYNTLRRVGYGLALAMHALFITIAVVATAVLFTLLLLHN